MQSLQKVLIIPVINIWPDLYSKTSKNRMRSTMKIVFLNGPCHISINGPTSYSKKARAVVVVTRAVESMICLNDTINQINHML